MSYIDEFNTDTINYAIPAFILCSSDWKDESWHNDYAPRFHNYKLNLCLWVNRIKKSNGCSTAEGKHMFVVCVLDEDGNLSDVIFKTNSETKLISFISFRTNAYKLSEAFSKEITVWHTPEELAEINRLNATAEYSNGACASHNYYDANQAMIDAFRAVFGREPSILLDSGRNARKVANDTDLCNLAWSISRFNQFKPQYNAKP